MFFVLPTVMPELFKPRRLTVLPNNYCNIFQSRLLTNVCLPLGCQLLMIVTANADIRTLPGCVSLINPESKLVPGCYSYRVSKI